MCSPEIVPEGCTSNGVCNDGGVDSIILSGGFYLAYEMGHETGGGMIGQSYIYLKNDAFVVARRRWEFVYNFRCVGKACSAPFQRT